MLNPNDFSLILKSKFERSLFNGHLIFFERQEIQNDKLMDFFLKCCLVKFYLNMYVQILTISTII